MSVSEILESIRLASTSERDKGDRFETLMRTALRTDRTYAEQFTDVWLWMDWPDRPSNEPDTGIDLVALNRDGGYTAIQCKNYSPTTSLAKEDIDSFFTASGRAPFTQRIIISTTDLWSRNAEKSLVGQQIPVRRIGVDDLDAMTIDWESVDINNLAQLPERKRHELRDHQRIAVEKVRAGFSESDRGKLIMACGTGKTFTGLRIAEDCGPGSTVLFLAPSIALVSQSLKEWTAESKTPIRPFAVCSDATAGKPLEGENATPYDLAIPPTTDVQALVAAGLGQTDPDALTVVFSTYQSIQVVADAQTATGLVFDLVMCDEAHRTAGASTATKEDSAFVKVHDNLVIPARKRLYMTATPKIYQPAAKQDAVDNDAVLASMDDPEFFGPEFHRLGFGDAVNAGLLADYKVLILTVEESAISESFQDLLSQNGELNLPDVAKFIGCLTGLAKRSSGAPGGFGDNEAHMQRAVAFWSSIEESERFAAQFDLVADHYNTEHEVNSTSEERFTSLSVPTRHVDGTTNIRSRRADIRWLKQIPEQNECRVLTNAKCLTEGVDVPALDAVMFLKPRRSKIDIVQAVGRVMRKPVGKDVGYIILPIAIPAGQTPSEALDKNADYDVVWDVLQALRSHDERFNAYINRIALREDQTPNQDDPIQVIDANPPEAPTDDEPPADEQAANDPVQGSLFTFQDWTEAIYTKIVAKVGTRTYWEQWASDVAAIAARHEARIADILTQQTSAAREFDDFLAGLHSILNDSITRDDAVSMLSQHLITRPIFEALFGNNNFTTFNPVSAVMQDMVSVLERHHLETETESLDAFYDSVRQRVEGIPISDGFARQTIIKDLYGRFFKIAFPKVADSLGIVYTPIEIVDFLIRATEKILTTDFGASLSDQGVHVLDPFTGTGTFITRLLQSGYIHESDVRRKFQSEIHANEILLLAYYIAAINIETTYQQSLSKPGPDISEYEPFPGIVYTDTFQQSESGDGTGVFDTFPVNNARADRQRTLDIQVIIGNPPYSVGQSSQNDDNQNQPYPTLDASIAATYAARSNAGLKRNLYDSYVRAIRWASNRIAQSSQGGVVSFVTNGGYIDGAAFDGLRLAFADEFHSIYCYNLRGNQRTHNWRVEGGKVFGEGSQATVAILLLVKRPGQVTEPATIYYKDIGDSLSREEKLQIVDEGQIDSIDWTTITPNESGDWINQRTADFTALTPLSADANTGAPALFDFRSLGLGTNRDAWNFASSRSQLENRTTAMIKYYNAQAERFDEAHPKSGETLAARAKTATGFVAADPTKISWNVADYKAMARGDRYSIDHVEFGVATYRPFFRQHVNFDPKLNNRVYQLPKAFPTASRGENLAICMPNGVTKSSFGALLVDSLPSLHVWPEGTLVFPLHKYPAPAEPGELFGATEESDQQSFNIGQVVLHDWSEICGTEIAAEDAFYYCYGVLHSPIYRSRFEADLKKQIPRVPAPRSQETFALFADAGRALGDMHLNYESIEPYDQLKHEVSAGHSLDDPATLRVEKMRYGKTSGKVDKTTLAFNEAITITGIPETTHSYRLGSRSALDWLVDRYAIRTDSKSSIVNDPNEWATEVGDPRYILDLVGRIVEVSVRTVTIMEDLPDPMA